MLPPIVAALRLPFTLLLGFVIVLVVDALMLLAADAIGLMQVDSFWSAFGVAVVASAASVVLSARPRHERRRRLHAARDPADRATHDGRREITDGSPGIVFLEIDGLALPVLQRAMRDGHAPTMARWLESGHAPARRMGDGSLVADRCVAGRDPARLERRHPGVPVGREGDGDVVRCSSPPQCAKLEQRHSTGEGLLADGGASRGNLFSGDADHVILTVSRMDARERHANPGYRSFLANGFNVMRTLVLTLWEVVIEWHGCGDRRAGGTSGRAAIAAAATR